MASQKRLEKQQAQMRERQRKAAIPAALATPELRVKRLQVIQDRMGITMVEFAMHLGLSYEMMRSVMEGRRKCSMPVLKLAERILGSWDQQRKVQKPKIPPEMANDPVLKMKILKLAVRGIPPEQIATILAIRPEVVAYFTAELG